MSITDTTYNNNDDDRAIIDAGYTPQLKRSLGYFSSFAVSFSFMSVLMGIFANYGFVLAKSGPFGIWTWLLVGAGQLLVSLVFAEMAGRIPLTGAIYNWNTRLANANTGWFSAWLLFFAYTIGTVGVVVALLGPLQSFLGISFSPNMLRVIGVGIILVQCLINIYSVRLAANINKLAVAAEIIALVVFGAVLLAIILINGEANTTLLTTIPVTPAPYWPGFLTASLLAAWTIFGFETTCDLSEETLNAKRVTPRSVLSSVMVTVILGFIFVTILTLAIPDLTTISAAADPVSAIVSYHLGTALTKLFLCLVLLGMFAASLVGITTATRLLFAVARDKRIIGAAYLTRVSSHGVPHLTTWVVVAIELAAFLLFQNAAALYASAVILLSLVYLITVISFIRGAKHLPTTSNFSLGRWHWPVVIMAVVWLVSEIGILTIPAEFHSAAIIAGSVAMAGLVLRLAANRLVAS